MSEILRVGRVVSHSSIMFGVKGISSVGLKPPIEDRNSHSRKRTPPMSQVIRLKRRGFG